MGLFVFAAVIGCDKKPVSHAAGFAAMSVKTRIVQPVDIPDASEYLATLKSRRSAVINPQVEGQIVQIFVRSGDHVLAGAPLLEIDPRYQQATVNSQEAARNAQQATLSNAEAQYERAQQLYSSGLISKQDFDTSRAAYENAKAQLSALSAQVNAQQVQLHYFTVAAPTDGIVGDIPVHIGDRVTTTTQLTTVDQPGSLEAYVYVPVEHSKDLHLGEPLDLLDDAGNVVAHSSLFFISPQVDNTTQSVLAKAVIPNPAGKLRNDEFIRARITWRIRKGLTVPVLVVSRISGQFFVFVTEKGEKGTVARQRLIHVGDIVGNNYVVLDGLKPGDHIVVGGFQFLTDGAAVKESIENNSPEAASS